MFVRRPLRLRADDQGGTRRFREVTRRPRMRDSTLGNQARFGRAGWQRRVDIADEQRRWGDSGLGVAADDLGQVAAAIGVQCLSDVLSNFRGLWLIECGDRDADERRGG